jgi:hypothetical protein
MTNLQTNNKFQEIIKKYLDENASEVLTEKINSGSKTLADCEAYIKKEAQKQAKGGCACIEDSVVYGWAIHFFEEDSVETPEDAPEAEVATSEPKRTSEIRKEQKKAEKAAAPKDELKTEQMSIFDFLGE